MVKRTLGKTIQLAKDRNLWLTFKYRGWIACPFCGIDIQGEETVIKWLESKSNPAPEKCPQCGALLKAFLVIKKMPEGENLGDYEL